MHGNRLNLIILVKCSEHYFYKLISYYLCAICFLSYRYSIFLTCWNINPKDRPNFEELVDIIDNLNGKDTNNDRQQQNHYFVLENNLYNTFEMQDQDLSRMSTADKSSTL